MTPQPLGSIYPTAPKQYYPTAHGQYLSHSLPVQYDTTAPKQDYPTAPRAV